MHLVDFYSQPIRTFSPLAMLLQTAFASIAFTKTRVEVHGLDTDRRSDKYSWVSFGTSGVDNKLR